MKNTLVKKDGVNMDALRQYFPEAYDKCRKQSVFTKFSTKVAKAAKSK